MEDAKEIRVRISGGANGMEVGCIFWVFGALFTMGLLGKVAAATIIFWPMELGNFVKALLP